VAVCRPTIDGRQVHTPGELAIATFTHHTSRLSPEVAAEPDRPPDPQLHSHVFVFNLAWCEPSSGQGRFLAVDSRPIFQFAVTAETIYACELAAQLQRIGYQLDWHQTRRGRVWELAGVDERLTELFSSRHRHIEALAAQFQAERGRPATTLERRRLAHLNRLAKTPGCRVSHWAAYHRVLDRRGLAAPTPRRIPVIEAAPLTTREVMVRARLLGADGLTAHEATLDEATLTQVVFQAAAGLLDAGEAAAFLERFVAGPDLVPVVVDGQPRLTTAALLAQERAIVKAARAKAASTAPAPTVEMMEQAAVEVARQCGYELSDEQQAVVKNLCWPVGWASLEGWAGTGKTTTLRTAVGAWRHNHQPVVVVSTAADTARRTAHELDLEPGFTIEAFCLAVEHGRLRPDAGMVVLVEEACMVDTPRMHRLLQAAGPAIIRTIGDPEQAQPVGPGGWHAQVDQAIGGHAELTRVVRQRDPQDREVCRLVRHSHADQALAKPPRLRPRPPGPARLLGGQGGRPRLEPAPPPAWPGRGPDRHRHLQRHHRHVEQPLPAGAPARRRAAGSEPGAGRPAGRPARARLHRRPGLLHPPLPHPECARAQRHQRRVAAVDPDRERVLVACDDGPCVPVELAGADWTQPLRLGYAGHALRLQGGQAPVVLVLPGSWQISRQSAYSMLTRCQDEVHVFVDHDSQRIGDCADLDPLAALARRWTRDAREIAASARFPATEDAPVCDAVSRASITRPDVDHAQVPMRTPEAARLRTLVPELAGPDTPAWLREPASERGLGDDLGIDL